MKLPTSHTVIGFHGTSIESAAEILRTGRFDETTDGWLGRGVYFWEDAPAQARWWAKDQKKETRPAVLASLIDLHRAADFLNPAARWGYRLAAYRAKAAFGVQERYGLTGAVLDSAVIDLWCDRVGRENGASLTALRALAVSDAGEVVGRRAWEGSRLVVNAHIQLCVRDPRCIVGTWPVAVTDDGGWHWKALQ